MIVDQLIPDEDSPASLDACQKSAVKILPIFSVSTIALPLCIVIPNTKRIISRPQPSVTMCLSIFSVMIRANITRKIRTAKICDTIMYLPHSHIIANGSRKRLTFAATIIMRYSRNWKIKFRFFENFFQLVLLFTHNVTKVRRCNGFVGGPNSAGSCYVSSYYTLL